MNSSNRYFSTFASGFEPIVEELLTKTLGNVKVELLINGLVVYSTDSPIEKVRSVKFFTNSFLLIRYFPNNKTITIEKMIANTLKDRLVLSQRLPNNMRTFRVVTSRENQPVSVNPKIDV